MGGGDGVPCRQPLRPGPAGARAAEPGREAHEGTPASEGWIGDQEGADHRWDARGQAGLRVPGPDDGEVRWAEWSEIDLIEGVWAVPAARMKTKREHRVSLCRRALEILDEARALGARTAGWCSRD